MKALSIGFIMTALVALSPSEGRTQHEGHHGHGGHDHRQHQELKASAPISDGSVYQLGSSWLDHNGKKLTLAELAGRPRLVTMVYTTCTSACPMLVGDMKGILSSLSAAEREKIAPLVVSFDPERDSPEALKKFAAKMKLDESQWTLLNGRPGDVSELAGVLGVQYKRLDSGDFIHSNVIFFLNEKGEIVARKEGLKTPSETFIADIRKALGAGKTKKK